MAVRLSALQSCSALFARKIFTISSINFCSKLSNSEGLLQLEGLCKLKEINDLFGTRTRNLPACSIVPQPSTLLIALHINEHKSGDSG
jgi:hypothetical protein